MRFSCAESIARKGTVSVLLNGAYGPRDMCLSLPGLVGKGRVQGRTLLRLTDGEPEKPEASGTARKKVIEQDNLS